MHTEMCGNNRENNSRDVRIVYPLTKRRSERVWRNPDSRDSVKKEKKNKERKPVVCCCVVF